jgi:hypothetical protein
MKYTKSKRGPYKRSVLGDAYIKAHPACEACGFKTEELHHIISRKTQGPDEDWNWLALCLVCHRIYHDFGRTTFAERFPHLREKIETACEKMGRMMK